jgi:hypothetical protein
MSTGNDFVFNHTSFAITNEIKTIQSQAEDFFIGYKLNFRGSNITILGLM